MLWEHEVVGSNPTAPTTLHAAMRADRRVVGSAAAVACAAGDGHGDGLDAVVAHALVVPRRLEGLDARLSASVARQARRCLPGVAVPIERPGAPREVAERRSSVASAQSPSMPTSTRLIGARPPQARPLSVTGPAVDEAAPREVIRDARRRHRAHADADARDRNAAIVRVGLVVVGGRPAGSPRTARRRLDRAQPLHAGHAVPARHERGAAGSRAAAGAAAPFIS